jgi:hypothetical protein
MINLLRFVQKLSFYPEYLVAGHQPYFVSMVSPSLGILHIGERDTASILYVSFFEMSSEATMAKGGGTQIGKHGTTKTHFGRTIKRSSPHQLYLVTKLRNMAFVWRLGFVALMKAI